MKQLPVNNAPANMQPWIRDVESILKQHDASLYDNVNTEVVSNATLNRRSVNLKTNLETTNATLETTTATANAAATKLANYPANITWSTATITCTGAGSFSTGITLSGFTNTPVIFTQLTVGSSANNTPLTVSGANQTSATISTYRVAAATVTFNWMAMGN